MISLTAMWKMDGPVDTLRLKRARLKSLAPARRHIEGRARGPEGTTVGCSAVRMMKSFRNEKEFDFVVGVTSISEKDLVLLRKCRPNSCENKHTYFRRQVTIGELLEK